MLLCGNIHPNAAEQYHIVSTWTSRIWINQSMAQVAFLWAFRSSTCFSKHTWRVVYVVRTTTEPVRKVTERDFGCEKFQKEASQYTSHALLSYLKLNFLSVQKDFTFKRVSVLIFFFCGSRKGRCMVCFTACASLRAIKSMQHFGERLELNSALIGFSINDMSG